jgi:hypothetical protein
MTPNLLEVGAAGQSAISASGLILARYGTYYGHDPEPYVQQTKARRHGIDLHMRRIGAAQWVRQRNA